MYTTENSCLRERRRGIHPSCFALLGLEWGCRSDPWDRNRGKQFPGGLFQGLLVLSPRKFPAGGTGRSIRLKCLKGKILSACQMHIIVPAISSASNPLLLGPLPCLGLELHQCWAILILFTWEETCAYFGKLARLPALCSPSSHRLGQLLHETWATSMAFKEAQLQGRQREPGNMGGGCLVGW